MPKITVHSNKYPGVQFARMPLYAAGNSYEITDEQMADIQKQFAGFSDTVKRDLQVYFEGGTGLAQTIGVANPTPAPSAQQDAPLPEEVPDISEDDLTDEDLDLVSVEVNKLLGKTVLVASPLLITTATNAKLPKTLRKFYLQEVIDHNDIQKTLKDKAQEILEQLK